MQDPVMVAGMVVFGVLFSFLLFIAVVCAVGFLRKKAPYREHLPRITVLIPTYNEEAHITRCIHALRANAYPGMELLILDDGSTDRTVARARAAIKGMRSASVLRRRHGGKVAALNAGLARAKGSVIVTIDADTFVAQDFLQRIVQPFQDPRVGATSGAVLVENATTLSGMFQEIEYHYNNLIRNAFSRAFGTGIWFFGCLAAYRASLLREIGGFSKDTLAEDMDIALECRSAGFKTINVPTARGWTDVPTSFRSLFRQRSRWWVGGLQSLRKHRAMLNRKQSPSVMFLFFNQYWWAVYAFLSLPLLAYQVHYWMPSASSELAGYLFRWFTLVGPFYVLYKLPVWGLSWFNIFGVLSGVISMVLILIATRIYGLRVRLRNLFAIFLYFPYTILLNLLVMGSVLRAVSLKKTYFIE